MNCTVDKLRLGVPSSIKLTAPWAAISDEHKTDRKSAVAAARELAVALAEEVETVDPGLAGALAAAQGHEKTLPVLIAAAQDLLAGIDHDGPRAFSQAHFGNTKARDDAPDILAAAGTFPATVAALGLTRSPYIGLGGGIVVTGRTGHTTQLWQFAGPVRFRVHPAPGWFSAELEPADGTITLAVVENLQAAETVCDAHGRKIAVAWCAGHPAARPLELIAALAAGAGRVLVAPDADWGGVRIADRLVNALQPGTPVEILDAGHGRHQRRDPFGDAASAGLELLEHSAADQLVREFAAAVRARGYPVEQESSVRAILAAALSHPRPSRDSFLAR